MKVVHNSKVNTEDIVAGTETVADIKDNKEETKEFLKKFEEYKKNYMKDRTTKDMVYEKRFSFSFVVQRNRKIK